MATVKAQIRAQNFINDLSNQIDYTLGSLNGVHLGYKKYLEKMGIKVTLLLGKYIDSVAKLEPERLHHVYEWNKVGVSTQRLFVITPVYTAVTGNSYSTGAALFSSVFTLSTSILKSRGSKVPFREKAYYMENNIEVTIRPKRADGLLRYYDEELGEQFDSGWVTSYQSIVQEPGGPKVYRQFDATLKQFFTVYLSQSKMLDSGFFKKPFSKSYSRDLKGQVIKKGARSRSAKAVGIKTGSNWLIGAGDLIVEE